MHSIRAFYSSFTAHAAAWTAAAAVLLLFWVLGFFARRILFNLLTRWSAKTSNQIDDIVILKSRIHVLIWAVLLGAYFAGTIAPVTPGAAHLLNRVIMALLMVSVTFMTANIVASIVRAYSQRISVSLPLTSLTENLIRLVIIAIGILVLLAQLGISITPLLTALGVGSLAVALALQDTLSNLFAGFYILANKQIRPGDYIKIDSGQEGFVEDISWRETRIKQLSNNIVIVPNSKIATAVVINYSLPEKEISVVVPAGVAYGSDLDAVERITVEVACEVLRSTAGGVHTGFEPFIRYTSFGDSAVLFNIILRVREFTDQYLVTHEMIKRLHARYLAEGIDIPFPQRTVRIVSSSRDSLGK